MHVMCMSVRINRIMGKGMSMSVRISWGMGMGMGMGMSPRFDVLFIAHPRIQHTVDKLYSEVN